MKPVAHRLERQRLVHIFLVDDLQHSSAQLVNAALPVGRAEAAFRLRCFKRLHGFFIGLMEIRVRRVLLADAGAYVQIQQPLERPAQLVDGRVQL